MNRHQARIILLGLGEPASEQRRADAIGTVIDLLMYPERVVAGTDREEGLANEREARLRAERLLIELRKAVKDVLDNDGDLLDESRRVRLARACRWSEIKDS